MLRSIVKSPSDGSNMAHLKDIEALLSDLFDFDRLAKRKR